MSSPTLPQYSVLMSVYSGDSVAAFRTAIESMLLQSIPPSEIVLVVDGPVHPEISAEILSLEQSTIAHLRVLRLDVNVGLWAALRRGLLECRYPIVARMDADDYSASDRIERQLDALSRWPELDCVGTLVSEFTDDHTRPNRVVRLPQFHSEILRFGARRNPLRHPTLVFRREAVLRAGSYQRMPFFEDYDLYLRMAATGACFHNVQDTLVSVRVGREFVKRRGGRKYLGHMLLFRWTAYRRGHSTLVQFMGGSLLHGITISMPNRFRSWVYARLLRAAPKD